jgi:tetratricopeptide (TPR) repeat protein
MIKNRIAISLVFFLLSVGSYAEPLSWEAVKNVDSLKTLLNSAYGEKRVDILNELCLALLKANPDKAYIYADQALFLADSLDYYDGMATTLWMKSFKYNSDYTLASSIAYLKSGLSYLDDNSHWTIRLRILSKLGRRYSGINKLDSSIYYFNQIIEIKDQDMPWSKRAIYLNYISEFQNMKKDYVNEEKILIELYNLVISHLEPCKFISIFGQMSYMEKLGRFYNRHGNYSKSIQVYLKVLNKIPNYNISVLEKYYFEAKFIGHIGRAYGMNGKFVESVEYHETSLELFRAGAKVAQSISRKSDDFIYDWEINIANQFEGIATIKTYLGEYHKAEMCFDTSILLRLQQDDKLGIAMSYDGLAKLYQAQGKFQKAFTHYDSSLQIKLDEKQFFTKKTEYFKAIANSHINSLNEYISKSYLDLGKLYMDWDKPGIALDYFKKSISTCNEISYPRGIAESLLAIGNVYYLDGKYDSAYRSFQLALKSFQEINYRPGIGEGYYHLGQYYFSLGKYVMSNRMFQKALKIFEELQIQKNMAETYAQIGSILLIEINTIAALDWFNKSVDIATELSLQKTLSISHKAMSDIYSLQGNTEKAFSHYRDFIVARDALNTIESNRQIAEIEANYESEKQENQIYLLEQENRLNALKLERSHYVMISLGGLALLLMLAAFIVIHNERLKSTQRNLILQQKLLRTQMNPHFIFNSLANIQSFIFLNETSIANTYLSRFAVLLRSILESSRSELTPLSKEITTIENYLELQKLRFQNKFDYILKVDENIETEMIKIPPMLAQPFIENCIEHGLQYKESKGHVTILVQQTIPNALQIIIEDDGIGRKKAREMMEQQNPDHKSMATEITRDRVNIINKKYKQKIKISIFDLMDDSKNALGTRVLIELSIFAK